MLHPQKALIRAQLTNSIGDGAYLVCSALYFTRVVGLTPGQVAAGLTLGWAAGFLAGVPLGHLADRKGPRGVAVLLAVATAAAVGGFLFVRTPTAFFFAAVFYGVGQTGLSVARLALLAALVDPPHRTRIRAHMQAALNAGLAIGAGLGGLALHFDTRAAYLIVLCLDATAFLIAATLLRTMPRVAPTPATTQGGPRLAVLRDKPYAAITALNTVLLLYMPLLGLVLPLWIVQRTEAPRWMVSAILILNTLSVMLFQVRVARRVTGLTSATRLLRYAGFVMLVSCGVFALTAVKSGVWGAVAILVLAAALQVIAEMMQASATWQISFDLAPAENQGQYQGLFGTSTAVARMAGPLLLTALIIGLGTPGWLILGGLFLAAALAMGPVVRWAEATRPATAT